MKQTTLRTKEITPNNNISFPIGTILTVQKQYQKLGFNCAFSKHKDKTTPPSALTHLPGPGAADLVWLLTGAFVVPCGCMGIWRFGGAKWMLCWLAAGSN